jgi:HAD superfamily hydrolase (TIGR01549 family)
MSLYEIFERYTNPLKETMQQIMDPVKAILFDMDGPLCHLFASFPASEVAHTLKLSLKQFDCLPEEAILEDDPFEVLRSFERTWPKTFRHEVQLSIWEQKLTSMEIYAALEAPPTAFVDQLLPALQENNIDMAIVTNNNTEAARNFLRTNEWHGFFGSAVFGRLNSDFRNLKPNPKVLQDAMQHLKMKPTQCLMIGDSVTDYQAAKASGVPFLGYSNTFSGAKRLFDAGAENVISDYVPLLSLYVEFIENDFGFMYK